MNKKINDKESKISITPKPSQRLLGYRIQSILVFQKKGFLRKKVEWRIDKIEKKKPFKLLSPRHLKITPAKNY